MLKIFSQLKSPVRFYSSNSFTREDTKKLLKLVKNSNNVDWTDLVSKFPGKDASDLLFHFEFVIKPELENGKFKEHESHEIFFTKEMDQKIIDVFSKIKNASISNLDKSNIINSIGGNYPWNVYKERFYKIYDDFSLEQQSMFIDLYNKGIKLQEIAKEMNLPMISIDKLHKRAANGLKKKKPDILPILARFQYRIIGPNFKELSVLLRSSPLYLKRTINSTTNIWNDILESKKTNHHLKWKQIDLARLAELRQSNVSWAEISEELGRSIQSCKNAFKTYRKGIKTGTFSKEEDFLIVNAWKKYQFSFKEYPDELPNRTHYQILSRLRLLSENLLKGRGDFVRAIELGLSKSEATKILGQGSEKIE